MNSELFEKLEFELFGNFFFVYLRISIDVLFLVIISVKY